MPPRQRYDQSDVPTDKIERAVDAGRRSGEHDTRLDDHERRIGTLEGASSEHAKQLADGRVYFAEIRRDIGSLTGKVGELTDAIRGAVKWIVGAFGILALATIVWALAHGAHP